MSANKFRVKFTDSKGCWTISYATAKRARQVTDLYRHSDGLRAEYLGQQPRPARIGDAALLKSIARRGAANA